MMIVVYFIYPMLIQGFKKSRIKFFSKSSFLFSRISLKWLCTGNSNNHHAVRLYTRDAVTSWQKQQVSLVEWSFDL
jgi:hypothetical protein